MTSLAFACVVFCAIVSHAAAQSCWVGGRSGYCISTSACSRSSVPGYCPGAADYQCCVDYGSCPGGKCISTSKCQGTTVSGLCPRSNDIKCCRPSSPAPGLPATPPPAPPATPPTQCRPCEIDFRFKAFIHESLGQNVDGVDGSWFHMVDIKKRRSDWSLSSFFGSTDNRGYDLDGSSKMSVDKKFSTSDIGRLSSSKVVTIGRTKIALKPPLFGASVIWDKIGTLTKNSFWVSNSPGKSVMHIRTASQNGGMPEGVPDGWNPDIDWDLRVTVTKGTVPNGQHTAQVVIEGSHDDFPWYEGYVNGRRIYGYASPFTDARSGILFGLTGALKTMNTASHTVFCPC